MTKSPPIRPGRRSRRRLLASVAITGAVGATTAAIGLPTASVTAAPGDTVQILSFNDYHGHVEAGTAGSIDGSFGGPAAGGGEFLSAKLTELRTAFTGDATFTVAAGDNIGASPFFSGLVKDEPSVETLNEMGLDISGVGNHEFDEGVAELLRMQNGGCHPVEGCFLTDYDPDTLGDQTFGGADFQWLAANVFDEEGTPGVEGDDTVLDLDDGVGFEDLGGYSIVDANGTDIAFIGMTLDTTDTLVAASGIDGYRFADEADTANALVPTLQGLGVEAIFVLLHEGGIPVDFEIDNDCSTGISGPIIAINEALSPEIDGVITGHTQQPYNCMLTDGGGGMRPVVSAWEHGKVVTEMTFEIAGDGDVDRSTLSVVNHPVVQDDLTADADITAIIDKWSPVVDDLAGDEVGRIAEDITRGGDPSGSDRGVESDAGNLVADAQFFAVDATAIEPDVAFMNPGGIRSDLEFAAGDGEAEDGIVTFGEAFTFQPFGNTVSVLPMTGAQIQSVLEEQCQPSDASRPFLHLGVSNGFTYDLAYTTQAGVCTAIEVTNVQIGGIDIVEGDTYNVVVNGFLADGGDNFDTFAEIAPGDRLPSTVIDIEALSQYLTAESPVAAPGTERVNEVITTLPAPPTAVDPVRLLESRVGDGFTTIDGESEGIGRLDAGETVELQVAGRGGVALDATAANLQVGAVFPDGSGFVTVYPCSDELPVVSSLNYNGDPAVSNSITSSLSGDGTVCIYTLKETDLYVDVNGFGSPAGSPIAVDPIRLLDDRENDLNEGTFDDQFVGGGPLAADTIFELEVTSRGDIVPDDAKAVLLNVVAVQPAASGFLAVFPCEDGATEPPLASNINYVPAGDFANGVITGLGDGGTVCLYSSQSTNLVVDLNGYVPADGTPDPVTPFRLVDTREGDDFTTVDGQFEGEGQLAAETVFEVQVTGRDDSVAAGAASAYLNVAVVDTLGSGFFTVFPCNDDDTVPNSSNVNYDVGQTVANSVQVPLTEDGTVCVFSSQATDFVMDITGFTAPVIPARPAAG